MKGALRTNMRREVSDNAESDKAVYVQAELERREMEACKKGEETVEARDFVQKYGKCY